MITPRENLDRMSEVLGVEMSELRTVDKYLADAGLRRKGVGRAPVQMTRTEMLRLLIGVMGAPVKSKPVEYVRDVSGFHAMTPLRPEFGSLSELPVLTGLTASDIEKMPLLDTLTRICSHIADNWPDVAGHIWFRINRSGGAFIQIHGGRDEACQLRIEIPYTGARDPQYGDMAQSATVSQHTLGWIGAVGADEEEVEEA